MTRIFVAPPRLTHGRVELVAASSPFDPAVLQRGRAVLVERGLRVSDAPDLSGADRYLAASDGDRLRALLAALSDPDVGVVLAARGGYGATRLLPLLDAHHENLTRMTPRLLCGFSDVTALHAWFTMRLGWRVIHGPVCTSVGTEPDVTVTHLLNVLRGQAAGAVVQGETLRGSGATEGVLMGGNLAVLMALAGTRYWPDLEGSVLLLEDVGERPFRLDRCLTQLMQVTDGLRGIRGVALGYFNNSDDLDKGHTANDTLRSIFRDVGVPVVMNLPVGHVAPNYALGLGCRVELDAGMGTLRMLEDVAA